MKKTRAINDEKYFNLIKDALEVCASYKPKFGKGKKAGVTLEEFQLLYREDPFYNWFGLDSPLMYAAHKAAGGMTSIYRQIGIGCERVFNAVIQDALHIDAEKTSWSYDVPTTDGKTRKLSLDARIRIQDIKNAPVQKRVREWLDSAIEKVYLSKQTSSKIKGIVFEVRQGYKSKDSKRQNADVANAANAYAHSYLPVVVLLSSQIDDDIAERYLRAQWLILKGSIVGTPHNSTYVFCKETLGYDLAAFFQRNSSELKTTLHSILESLLK